LQRALSLTAGVLAIGGTILGKLRSYSPFQREGHVSEEACIVIIHLARAARDFHEFLIETCRLQLLEKLKSETCKTVMLWRDEAVYIVVSC
jgi:ABC-type molybdate transport system substrate-binding protein